MSTSSNRSQISTLSTFSDMELVDAENHSLVKINGVEGGWNDMYQSDVDDYLNPKSISQLNHWLGTLPVAATAISGNSSQLMTCSFEFSQLVQAKD